jgi:hemerythrin
MSFIDWTENERLNIGIIDEQHKDAAELLNELHETLGSNRTFLEKNLVQRMLKHFREHFDTEERLMKESKFPFFISHKMEHDRFYNKIDTFYRKLEQDEERVTLELLNSIKTWLFNHLEINDKKCTKFFVEKGMS